MHPPRRVAIVLLSSYVLFCPSRNGFRIGLLGWGVRRPSPQTPRPGSGRRRVLTASECRARPAIRSGLALTAKANCGLFRCVLCVCVCVVLCCVSAPPVACPSAGMGTAQFPFRGADFRPKKGGVSSSEPPRNSSTGVPDTSKTPKPFGSRREK